MPRPKGYPLNPDALLDLLEARVLSKSELVAIAEMSLGALRDLETGRRAASIVMVRRLSNALHCRPRTLFPTLGIADAAEDGHKPAVVAL